MPKFCSECGHDLPSPSVNFCAACGHAVQPRSATPFASPRTSAASISTALQTPPPRAGTIPTAIQTPVYKQPSLFDNGVVTEVQHRGRVISINRSLTKSARPVGELLCPYTDCNQRFLRGTAFASHKRTCKHRFKHKAGKAAQITLSRDLFLNRMVCFSFHPKDAVAGRCFYAGGTSVLYVA